MSNLNITTKRWVSRRQQEVLWEFLNSHRELATGFNRSMQAKENSKRLWCEIAEILNAQGDGSHKSWKEWSKYWIDYKAKIKKKMSSLHLSHSGTGGGPSTEQPLTDIESKFLQVLGEDFGQGLPGIRVEPFSGVTENSRIILDDAPASSDIMLEDSPLVLNPENGTLEPREQEPVERASEPVYSPTRSAPTPPQSTF